jgi:putative NADH-flavin reductase
VVEEALEADHEVVAFTRSPEKLSRQKSDMRIVEGDLSDADAIDSAIQNSDAVISVLAPANNKDLFVISTGVEKIIATMEARGVRRLIVTAGAGVHDPNDRPNFMSKAIGLMVRTISKNVYEDMVSTVEIVRSSELDWTVVRVPRLTDGSKAENIVVAWVGRGMGRQIRRANLAEFVVGQLEDVTYICMAPAISN